MAGANQIRTLFCTPVISLNMYAYKENSECLYIPPVLSASDLNFQLSLDHISDQRNSPQAVFWPFLFRPKVT